MSIDQFKEYTVSFSLEWLHGAISCNGDMKISVLAGSEEHAVSMATDQLREWFQGDIEGVGVDVDVDG